MLEVALNVSLLVGIGAASIIGITLFCVAAGKFKG